MGCVYLGLSVRLGLVVARNVAVPTRDVGARGEAERGRERSTLATKKLFARILILGGKSNSLPAPRSPAHSAESRAATRRESIAQGGERSLEHTRYRLMSDVFPCKYQMMQMIAPRRIGMILKFVNCYPHKCSSD